MKSQPERGRALKQRVRHLLQSDDLENAIEELCRFPGRRVINPLFSLLYDRCEKIKWAVVSAMGAVVSKLADEEVEEARIIMRRLMWNLNDESGGIGWGSPEAMGEILARHEGLAREYSHVFTSYTMKDWNYLEHEMLQRGLLWGIGRLGQVRPELLKDAEPHLLHYLDSKDTQVRGLAVWVMGILRIKEARQRLDHMREDDNLVQIYYHHEIVERRIMDLANDALKNQDGPIP
jgi:hypothetical protein